MTLALIEKEYGITPGPWKVVRKASGGAFIYSDGRTEPVAGVRFGDYERTNARAIAEVPEMLALLHAISADGHVSSTELVDVRALLSRIKAKA